MLGVMQSSYMRCDKIPNVLSVFNMSGNNDVTANEEQHVLPIALHLCGNDKPFM